MAPKEKQKIEIEKTHREPLLSFNQAVTLDCSDFLGTALIGIKASFLIQADDLPKQAVAFAFSIGPGGIEEIAAELHRKLECRQRLAILRSDPIHSTRPCPIIRARFH